MDFTELWEKALKRTEIIRSRVQGLTTYSDTRVPYILLSESSVNMGDTVVRQGEVLIQKPSLYLPPNLPQLDGFEWGDLPFDQNSMTNFLYVRGVSLPSYKYNNHTNFLDIYEGNLSSAIKHYNDFLQQKENVQAGLLAGPEDCWQFSLLVFVCTQITRNLETDMRRLLDDYHKKQTG